MPQLLTTLSQFLELGRATITQDELSAVTDDVRDAMLSLKILVPTRTATHVVCDACHEDHVEEVVRIKSGNEVAFRIRCPDAGWVDVPPDRLRQWTLDASRLVSLLAAGIGPSHAAEAVIPDLAWRLGSVEIAGVVLNVVLVRGGRIASLGPVAAKLPPQRTVIVRTADAPDMVDGYAATLALSSAFVFNSNRFEFQVHRVRVLLTTDAVASGNVFQRRGEFWQMSFEGVTTYFKDSVGIGYIARLLVQPHKSISAITLLAARAGIDPRAVAGTSGEILDEESRRQFSQRYGDLEEELEEAERNNDLGRRDKIEKEREQLMVQLAAAVDIRGRVREQTDVERVRKSVSEAVRRDIERIAKEHPALGRHLDASINRGTIFRYAPDRRIDWLT
ncbi:MAG: hypothetical protein KatS3mg114_0456 [Planctomycetaceae bacterium]|nr:MAG: hypothetical protein KatS3mg114_0456 [Planctomycetaceae bacterium]